MSDIHTLPLRGRELPEAPPAPKRVTVFKDGERWCWYHQCGTARDWGFWETAYLTALSHARRCCS